MGVGELKKINLKNGKEVVIREAKKEDAQAMIDFYNYIGGETDFLSFGKNDFYFNLEEYESYIKSTNDEENSIILIATIDNEIISIASIKSNQKSRSKHVGTLGIGVCKQCFGLGLGTKLINDLIDWAKLNGITKKISLATREDNHKAIQLYKRLGFEEEGILRQDNYINGLYYNTVTMGLII